MNQIKITNAALADWGSDGIILRGVIDAACLGDLKVGSYQREVERPKHIRTIMKGFRTPGGVPDIELGMRGHSFTEAGGDFFLHDNVYIIDGLQRRTAAMKIMGEGIQPRLGCMVHFDTTDAWENDRFKILNQDRKSVSASVLIRNLQDENSAIKMIFDLGLDSTFPLYRAICWGQNMKRGEKIKGQTVLNVACQLHRRHGAGLTSSKHSDLSVNFNHLMSKLNRATVRNNIKTYWEVLDEAFNIREVQIASAAPYLKNGFLKVFARFLAEHEDFWEDRKLVVPSDLRRKLGMFKIHSPDISRLCAAAGSAQNILYSLLSEHMNSGKRTKRLKKYEVTEYISPELYPDAAVYAPMMAAASVVRH